MKHLLRKIFRAQHLTREEAREAMVFMMEGQAGPEEIAAFLAAMAAKGETAAELVGCVEAMRSKALPFQPKRLDLIDVCGTGGDDLGTFNISTTNALLLSACGLGVVKHGNRAVSSQSGSADVLEELGITIAGGDHLERLEKHGFVFLFAPDFHPAMKHVGPVRRALGLRTLFNLLGPLANPAPVKRQVIGVYEARLVPLMAEALLELGIDDALVVCGEDGLDEISLSAPTLAVRVRKGRSETLTLTPEDFGCERSPVAALRGGSSRENAAISRSIFTGETGPRRDVVLINAAAALVIAGQAENWRDGFQLAAGAISDGRALKKIEELGGKTR